jgi:hypothetical protein
VSVLLPTVWQWATTAPAKCAAVASTYNTGYFCDLAPGHEGDHECTCVGYRWPALDATRGGAA